MWYYLKDLVKAWDLLIGTAKERLVNQNSHDLRVHNMIIKPTKAQKSFFALVKSKGYNLFFKKNGEVNLLGEETYKYDLVEVTRELMQVSLNVSLLL